MKTSLSLREQLKPLIQSVLTENKRLQEKKLAILTWGNASAIDRDTGIVAIKPSGVEYQAMEADDITLCGLDGKPVESALNPSSDLLTHLELYKAFDGIGGVVHTHSFHATAFAQACVPLACLGTTHADNFYGTVPVTGIMTDEEISGDYEKNTGLKIIETFRAAGLDPMRMKAVLVANHGPFTWGGTVEEAVENAIVLEAICEMAVLTRSLAPGVGPVSQALLDKHFLRKHGENSYYGQKT